MGLNNSQLAWARFIYRTGRAHGLSNQRAIELALGAYHESGLNPKATNPSSGAAGFFQLLSQGYRDKAKKMGGLYNPRANLMAILPDYVNYWRSHPGAVIGAGAAGVERSGQGATWYGAGYHTLAKSLQGSYKGGSVTPPSRPGYRPTMPVFNFVQPIQVPQPRYTPQSPSSVLNPQTPYTPGYTPQIGAGTGDLYAQIADLRSRLLAY